MLGSNVPTRGGFHTGFKWAEEWGCECIQIYITLSRKWEVQELMPDEVERFKKAWRNSSVRQVVAHIPFLVNLASPDKRLWKKSVDRLTVEISRAKKLGVPLLVLHPGSYGQDKKKDGLKRIIAGLNTVLERFDNLSPKILLETMAGQGTTLGSSFEELAYILAHTNQTESLGVCFDTGHVYMAGYDIRGYKGYKNVLKEFSRIIPFKKIGAFHLNDSKTALGSKSDRHASIGEGELGFQPFHMLLRDQRFSDIPKILEIPERDEKSKDNLKLLKQLSNRSALLSNEDL